MKNTTIKAIYYITGQTEEMLESSANILLKEIYENQNNFKIQTCHKYNEDKTVFLAFVVSELDKIKSIDKDIIKLIEDLKDESKKIACIYCDSIILNYSAQNFREYGGCVGRTRECIDCSNLNNESVEKIGDVFREKGHESAIALIEELYAQD